MAAANDDSNIPIAEIVRNSPGMNPPRSPTMAGTTSTTAEIQQQRRSNTSQRSNMARVQRRSNMARAMAMAAASDGGNVPITEIVRNSLGITMAEQQQQLTSHPGAKLGSSTIAEQQQQ